MKFETIYLLKQNAGTNPNDHCHVLGYTAPGDTGGGEFYWDSTSTADDDGGTIFAITGSSAPGRWKRLYSGAVYPTWFGAKGDGSTDDTALLSYCLNNFPQIDLDGRNFKVSNISITNDTSITNGVISLFLRSRISLYANLIIEQVTFDALEQPVRTALLYGRSGSITASNCTFKNIKTTTPPSSFSEDMANQYGIISEMAGCHVMLDNVCFENISAMGDADGSETYNGFCGGIYLFGEKTISYLDPTAADYYQKVYSDPSKISITNCIFKNIYTLKHPLNGGALDTDADAIRISITSYNDSFDINHNILIDQNRFIDIQKSCVKAGNFNGLVLTNSVISTEKMTTRPMVGAFRIQPVKNVLVSNVLYNGSCTFLMYARGSKHIHFHNISNLETSMIETAFQVMEDCENIDISDSNITCGRFLNIEKGAGTFACNGLRVTDCHAVQQTAQSPFVRISKAPDVSIAGCQLITIDTPTIDCITILDTPNFSLSNSSLFYGRSAIVCTENNLSTANNITISSSKFERQQYATGSRHLLLRATTGTNPQLTGIIVSNCYFSANSQTTKTNDEIMLITAKELALSDLQLIIHHIGTNDAQPSQGLIQLLQCSKVNINNITASHDYVPTGAAFAVLLRECNTITINGVSAYNADAVTLYDLNIDKISATNIFSKIGRKSLEYTIATPPANRYFSDFAEIL
ncbi:hypothetical protein [Chitinophaga defluvii]|uniref:Parallel beta helix pectate lyase-like protein n=1 Tax=Chitinophaga defluvii TaxID=3163343 RepID=A0ABV2T9A0_9BACT